MVPLQFVDRGPCFNVRHVNEMVHIVFVYDQVEVSTKSPHSDKQYVWESVADSSSYMIREETDPEKLLSRGTQITLYLRVIYFSILLHWSLNLNVLPCMEVTKMLMF